MKITPFFPNVIRVNDDPSFVGVAAPSGTLALYTQPGTDFGFLYIKFFDSVDTGWMQISGQIRTVSTVGVAPGSVGFGTAGSSGFKVSTYLFTITGCQEGGAVGANGDAVTAYWAVTVSNVGGVATILDAQQIYGYKVDPAITITFSITGPVNDNVLNVILTGVVDRDFAWTVFEAKQQAG